MHAWSSFFLLEVVFFLLVVVCVKSCFSYFWFWVCPVKNHSLSFELGPAKETHLVVLFLFLCNHLNVSFSVNNSAPFLHLSLYFFIFIILSLCWHLVWFCFVVAKFVLNGHHIVWPPHLNTYEISDGNNKTFKTKKLNFLIGYLIVHYNF